MIPGRSIRNGQPRWPILVGFVLALGLMTVRAQTVINEGLFNPTGSTDSPGEKVELRGTPNGFLSNTYLLTL